MGTELVAKMSENLHILMRLSDQENFIQFCRCESLKTYTYSFIPVSYITLKSPASITNTNQLMLYGTQSLTVQNIQRM